MTALQVLLLLLAAAVATLLLQRMLAARSVRHYSPQEAAERMKTGEALLLDVRTGGEWERGAIPRSLHIPLQHLRSRAGELEVHREKEIICYCAVGSRSVAAAAALRRQGFRAASLKGGIAGWTSSGLRL